MSSSDSPSKRERQKQRREAKLAEQRAAESRARRNRLIAFAALAAVFIGLIGWAIADRQAGIAAAERDRQIALEKASELGCTPDEETEDAGQGHLDGASLAEQPPDALYPDRPAASGQHYGNWIKTGVYDQLIDERALVHNLEHGYVLGYYDDGAEDDQVAALKEYAQSQIDGKFQKVIVSPWDGDLKGDANFAYVSWNQRQMCAEYDELTFKNFLVAHHSAKSKGPENTLTPHLEEGRGTIDPGEEDFLLPPLGDQEAPTEGGMESLSETTEIPSE